MFNSSFALSFYLRETAPRLFPSRVVLEVTLFSAMACSSCFMIFLLLLFWLCFIKLENGGMGLCGTVDFGLALGWHGSDIVVFLFLYSFSWMWEAACTDICV